MDLYRLRTLMNSFKFHLISELHYTAYRTVRVQLITPACSPEDYSQLSVFKKLIISKFY